MSYLETLARVDAMSQPAVRDVTSYLADNGILADVKPARRSAVNDTNAGRPRLSRRIFERAQRRAARGF